MQMDSDFFARLVARKFCATMRSLIVAIVIFLKLIEISVDCSVKNEKLCQLASGPKPIEEVIDRIVEEISRRSECIVFVFDAHYKRIINFNWIRRRKSVVPFYAIFIRESESFFPPRARVATIVNQSKDAGCDAYVILVANPFQVSQFLRYTEKERLIDTRGSFVMIHDWRLFEASSKYLWNRITNVVLIRQMSSALSTKKSINKRLSHDLFNLETVYYPVRIKSFVLTRYLDTWSGGKFRYGIDHFAPKIRDLRGKSLKIAVFEHIPAVTRQALRNFQRFGEKPNRRDELDKAFGIEYELINIIGKKIKFQPIFYAPHGIEISKWGKPGKNDTFDGLIGESLVGKAAFLIGDLHYTPRHNRLLDLSLPYNTECLTFLTPEAFNDNSWKLLIVPFKLYTWIAVILTLLVGAYILHLFALTYRKYILRENKKITALIKRNKSSEKETPQGLRLFTEPINSIMYTYGMLLQVSLPQIPKAWAVRVFIGWWWLYGILVTVAYRASMTATLANPVSRVTIDTIADLVKSRLPVGGWTDEQRDLFLSSSDFDIQKIGERFELTTNEEEAIARVANGTFCYYENIYVLRQARAIRRQLEFNQRKIAEKRNEVFKVDRDLHVMQDCLIDMPIAIGMDKNSPLKPHVDSTIRRVVEAGFVAKWLSDVTEWTKIVELRFRMPPEQTLVNLHKLHGALVALGIGYFLSFLALAAEKLHWKYIVEKNPQYDKYQMDIFYGKAQIN